MATNQTTNYQLNQWEPTDQVLRTDFNADNAKLDAALAQRRSGPNWRNWTAGFQRQTPQFSRSLRI